MHCIVPHTYLYKEAVEGHAKGKRVGGIGHLINQNRVDTSYGYCNNAITMSVCIIILFEHDYIITSGWVGGWGMFMHMELPKEGWVDITLITHYCLS